jgi:DNA primase
MNEVIDILESFLGTHSRHYSHSGQITFDCPNCDNGRHKANLEVNYKKNVFSCWSCRDTENGVKGKDIRWLIYRFAPRDLFKEYCELNPSFYDDEQREIFEVGYPESFKNFTEVNSKYPEYKKAYQYLKDRGLSDDIILDYNLGYCDKGKYNNRIIIPSYDKKGEINYFIGRDYSGKSKIKYLNHQNSKQDIIFNEYYINWDMSVFLVEGVFDHLVLDNSIPILGKTPSNLLIHTLQKRLKGNLYIALDGDAKKTANFLGEKLNFGNLRDKIFIIDLPDNEDISSIYQKSNYKKLYTLLIEGVRAV